ASSPELGAPIGPNPSRGPLTLAGNHNTPFPARSSQTANIFRVQMISVLKRTQHDDCLVLVKQFRPPLGCYTLEFPAGLMNSGESVESAALRELEEETGFVAEVTSVSPAALCLEPGICSSADKIVCVVINGDDPANTRPQQQLGEFVDVMLIPIRELLTRIQGEQAAWVP
uniref:Nudix (nucleoside diphosphate linked moiety X)-type motif 5 n=1 Tax=Eptatretus burgeri TaxID=7764 RepID=A0A8C4R7D9_EPTBU